MYSKMEKLVSCLVSYEKSNVKLSEEVLAAVVDRAAASRLPPHLHVSLLSLSRKKQLCDDGDMLRIAQFSMQLLKSEWSDTETIQHLSEKDLQTEEGRKEVFKNCLKEAKTWQKKKVLVDVICSWPDFTTSSEERNPCYQFMEMLLSDSDNQEENGLLLKMLVRRALLSEEEIMLLIENATEAAIANVLWIILLAKNPSLNEIIPTLLQKEKYASSPFSLSDELTKEFLENDLFVKLVSTVAYAPILHYIMNCETDSASEKTYSLSWAVQELTKANCLAEAGQLKLLQMGVPASLKGFSQSVKCHKRLSHKHCK